MAEPEYTDAEWAEWRRSVQGQEDEHGERTAARRHTDRHWKRSPTPAGRMEN